MAIYKTGTYELGDFKLNVSTSSLTLTYKDKEINLRYSKSMKKLLLKILRVPKSNEGYKISKFNKFEVKYTKIVNLKDYVQGVFYLSELKTYVIKHPYTYCPLFISDSEKIKPYYLYHDEGEMRYTKAFDNLLNNFTCYLVDEDVIKKFKYKIKQYQFSHSGWDKWNYEEALKNHMLSSEFDPGCKLPHQIYMKFQLDDDYYSDLEDLLFNEKNSPQFEIDKFNLDPNYYWNLDSSYREKDLFIGLPGKSIKYPKDTSIFSTYRSHLAVDLYTNDLYAFTWNGSKYEIIALNPDYTIKSKSYKFDQVAYIIRLDAHLVKVPEKFEFKLENELY